MRAWLRRRRRDREVKAFFDRCPIPKTDDALREEADLWDRWGEHDLARLLRATADRTGA